MPDSLSCVTVLMDNHYKIVPHGCDLLVWFWLVNLKIPTCTAAILDPNKTLSL